MPTDTLTEPAWSLRVRFLVVMLRRAGSWSDRGRMVRTFVVQVPPTLSRQWDTLPEADRQRWMLAGTAATALGTFYVGKAVGTILAD